MVVVVVMVAHWATLPQKCSKSVRFEGIPRYGPVTDRRSGGQYAIGFLGRRLHNPSSWGGMDLDGFGETATRSPLDGQHASCSPDSNDETPRPATGCCARGNSSPERLSFG